MQAITVLQKCLSAVFSQMHASRRDVLLGAVTALLLGRTQPHHSLPSPLTVSSSSVRNQIRPGSRSSLACHIR
ncbi:MAG: hypothetical protein FD165_953 [Gammaproteobacteria bacterium]|nr:MAG: hypothetical protein FD165_953 [Gammaproteobacteria bacterium]